MLRCFHKAGYKCKGYRISAYGGIEMLEMIVLLSQGAMYGDIEFDNRDVRTDIISGKRTLQLKLKCHKCHTNCTGMV